MQAPTQPRVATLRHPPAGPAALALALGLLAALAAMPPTAQAHEAGLSSDLSAVSALPVALSIAAPSMLLAAGAQLVVVSVEASARGTVWVLERVSDGLRFSVQLVGDALVAVGTGVTVVAISTGWLLSSTVEASGRALCFIPNAVGATLLYNEQVTR